MERMSALYRERFLLIDLTFDLVAVIEAEQKGLKAVKNRTQNNILTLMIYHFELSGQPGQNTHLYLSPYAHYINVSYTPTEFNGLFTFFMEACHFSSN